MIVVLLVAGAGERVATPVPSSIAFPPPDKTEAKLDFVIKSIRFKNTPMADVFKALKEEAGVNMVVDWRALEAGGLNLTQRIDIDLKDIKLCDALDCVFFEFGTPVTNLAWTIKHNALWIGTHESSAAFITTQIYNVNDLLNDSADTRGNRTRDDRVEDLARLIQELVVPDTWRESGGQVGVIKEFSGRLIISQSYQVHRQIQAILDALRESIKTGGTVKVPM